MVSPLVLRPTIRPDLYVCTRCSLRARNGLPRVSRRGISQKYLAKLAEAERDWEGKAIQIRNGKRKSMLSILEERGYINQIAGKRNTLDNLLTSKRVGAYVGIDPTSPSIHIGHMIPLMSLFWMYIHGFHTVTLLGGATAKVGDPTGRTKDRDKVQSSVRTENMVRMHYQLKKLWANVEAYARKKGYTWEWAWHRELANNNAWMNKLGVMDLLQTIGPGMRMGTMLSRDTVKNKMSSSDGMSFAEFTYPILQAWDWWHMYQTKDVQLQIGGSDQFGNIVAGIDAINYLRTNHNDPVVRKEHEFGNILKDPAGFTTNLMTSSTGEKIGKSAGNALWLDGEMTSPFDLYGYWLRQPDQDVAQYLKLFTFLPMDTIRTAVKEHMLDPKQRKGQHLLAREFVEIVHGEQTARNVEAQHRLMFSKSSTSPPDPEMLSEIEELAAKSYSNTVTLNSSPSPTPTIQLPESLIYNKSIGQILHAAGLATSRSEGHKLAANGGVYIGGQPDVKYKAAMYDAAVSWVKIRIWKNEETSKFITNNIMTLRKGKSTIRIIQVVSDDEWKKLGKTYPGEDLAPEDPVAEPPLDRAEKRLLQDRTPAAEKFRKVTGNQPMWKVGGWAQSLDKCPSPGSDEGTYEKNELRWGDYWRQEALQKNMIKKAKRRAHRRQERMWSRVPALMKLEEDRRLNRELSTIWGRDAEQEIFPLDEKKFERREDAERMMYGWKERAVSVHDEEKKKDPKKRLY